jgi:DNA repair protein RecN (Recombination protein N)
LLEEQQQLDDQADSRKLEACGGEAPPTGTGRSPPASYAAGALRARTGTINHRQHAYALDAHGVFDIDVSFDEHTLTADADRIEFRVTTNPGQPLQAISKVASGGELSRIALAIQVITARKMETPALIFDEVDVGISGPTAAVVGKLLRQLGESTQVMCDSPASGCRLWAPSLLC